MKAALIQIARQLRVLIARAIVRQVDDAGPVQFVQLDLFPGETRRAQRLQQYGLSGVPPVGSSAVTGSPGGKRSDVIALGVESAAHRPRGLKPGEVVLYTMFGDAIHLREGRVIRITAGTKVTVDAPLAVFLQDVEIAGKLTVTGETSLATTNVKGVLDATGDVTVDGRSLKHHRHNIPGGETGPALPS